MLILKKCTKAIITVLVVVFALSSVSFAETMDNKTTQVDRKYRIGYLEGGPFWVFDETLKAIKKSLDKMGWGDKIEFPKDAFFSPGWEPEKKEELDKRAKELMARDDLDLIITAGSDATEAILKANNGRIPIIAESVSDAVKSKFVVSEKDSGVDNFTVRIVPGRYLRMFKLFHDVVKFKKLGLIFPDTENGRKFTNLEDALQAAKERGFEVVEYKKLSRAESTEECLQGIEWLLQQGIDAFFIPSLVCTDWTTSDVEKLINLLMEHKIPTFAREGTKYVKAGALMGFSSIDFTDRGVFLADKMVKILQGAKPRSLPMVDERMPKLSFNLSVAEKIGFNAPFDLLATSDEIFKEITLPEDRLVK